MALEYHGSFISYDVWCMVLSVNLSPTPDPSVWAMSWFCLCGVAVSHCLTEGWRSARLPRLAMDPSPLGAGVGKFLKF